MDVKNSYILILIPRVIKIGTDPDIVFKKYFFDACPNKLTTSIAILTKNTTSFMLSWNAS